MAFSKEEAESMRVVIDARLWGESGIGRYIRNLVLGLEEIDQTNEYFILHLQKDFDNIRYQTNNFQKILADYKWYGVEEQRKLPGLLQSLKPDLVHFPHFNVPVFYQGKFVVTIHDLIHQHFQTRATTTLNPFLHKIKKIGYRAIFSHAVKKSAKIITPSDFVRGQLVSEWQINKEKIVITHEGVDGGIIALAKEVIVDDFQKIADKFRIKKPYLFYLGNAQPHKNLSVLIEVFTKLKKSYPDLRLVLSGPNNQFWQKLQKKSEDGVVFTGFVAEEEMVSLYKNASCFIMPSLEEGFGIPILEAMACSCPVVSSNAGSLPEVGGNAALYFNPQDVNDMVEKINQVLEDKKIKNKLIEKGQRRYKEFSWKKMAEETVKVYLTTK